MGIKKDRQEYEKRIKKLREKKVKEFLKTGKVIGKRKGKAIEVPYPILEIPRFKYGSGQQGGIGQGEGEEGDSVGEQPGEEEGKVGDKPGDHMSEVWDISDLAKMMAEELELPNIEPKGNNTVEQTDDVLRSISKVGPPGRLHRKRTYKEALKRHIAMDLPIDEFNPLEGLSNERVYPAPQDRRYRTFKNIQVPEMNALLIYMMDVSGSMGEMQKEWVRRCAWWIDVWLSVQYKGLESRYIIHDAAAKIVSKDEFFHTKESGGTLISSAYQKAYDFIMTSKKFKPTNWNIYILHFSDGDNWSGKDTEKTFEIMDQLFPMTNMIGYTQVTSDYGSGQFLKELGKRYDENHEKLATAKIDKEDEVMDAIKSLLGKGR